MCLSLFVCECLSLSIAFSINFLFIFYTICCMFLSFCLRPCLSLSVSLSISLCLSLSLSLSLTLYHYLYVSPFLSRNSLCFYLSWPPLHSMYWPSPQEGSCYFEEKGIGATMSAYRDVTHRNETALQEAVAIVSVLQPSSKTFYFLFSIYSWYREFVPSWRMLNSYCFYPYVPARPSSDLSIMFY